MALLPSGLPDLVGDDEDLARFLTQRGHFSAVVAKPTAFLPNPRDRETSVSRHGREPLGRLWRLGLAAAGGRALHGAAILKTGAVRRAQLEVAADEPPDFHAAIRGWPWIENDPDLQRAQHRELALVLASAAGAPLLR